MIGLVLAILVTLALIEHTRTRERPQPPSTIDLTDLGARRALGTNRRKRH